jgi:hypothetical protein
VWKIIEMINSRELSPILSYINDRLTQRPFHAYLWLIWIMALQAIVLWHVGTAEHDRLTAKSLFLAAIAAMIMLFFIGRLAMLLCSSCDREWLFTKMPCRAAQPITTSSVALVRVIPLLGVIYICEFLFFKVRA